MNRQNRKGKLWSPSKDMRVCSKHFIDGEPTSNNPYPTEHLGYDSRRRVQNITPCSKRRKLYHLEDSVSVEEDNQATIDSCSDLTVSMSTHSIDITQQGMPLPDLNSTSLCEHDQNMDVSEGETLFPDLNSTEITQNDYLSSINTMNTLQQEVTEESLGEVQSNDEHKVSSVNFFSLLIMWFSTFLLLTHALTSLCKMKGTLLALKRKVKRLEWEKKVHFKKIVCLQKELSTCKCKKPLHSTLLNDDKSTKCFTGFRTKAMFNTLHDFIAPLVQRRWKGVRRLVNRVRPRAHLHQKRGPKRKLESKDEFLLTMKKLRLGLLLADLASRFKISTTLCGQIFTCWIRAMAKALSSMVFVPCQGVLNVTAPDRFKNVLSVHSIIDCSELFIETPQDHDLQAITWSTYKHHNNFKISYWCSTKLFHYLHIKILHWTHF